MKVKNKGDNKMVKIDKEKCIGCGVCVNICPEAFKLDNEIAKVISENATCITEAANACPVNAIITDTSSQTQGENSPQINSSFTRGGSGRGMVSGGGAGRGAGRGMPSGGGRGRNKGTGQGRGGYCVCPNCGHSQPHQRGVPCYQTKCPKCNSAMIRR